MHTFGINVKGYGARAFQPAARTLENVRSINMHKLQAM
jgi:hypothetical protein